MATLRRFKKHIVTTKCAGMTIVRFEHDTGLGERWIIKVKITETDRKTLHRSTTWQRIYQGKVLSDFISYRSKAAAYDALIESIEIDKYRLEQLLAI